MKFCAFRLWKRLTLFSIVVLSAARCGPVAPTYFKFKKPGSTQESNQNSSSNAGSTDAVKSSKQGSQTPDPGNSKSTVPVLITTGTNILPTLGFEKWDIFSDKNKYYSLYRISTGEKSSEFEKLKKLGSTPIQLGFEKLKQSHIYLNINKTQDEQTKNDVLLQADEIDEKSVLITLKSSGNISDVLMSLEELVIYTNENPTGVTIESVPVPNATQEAQ